MIFLKPSDHSLRWKKEADPEGPRIVGSGGAPSRLPGSGLSKLWTEQNSSSVRQSILVSEPAPYTVTPVCYIPSIGFTTQATWGLGTALLAQMVE